MAPPPPQCSYCSRHRLSGRRSYLHPQFTAQLVGACSYWHLGTEHVFLRPCAYYYYFLRLKFLTTKFLTGDAVCSIENEQADKRRYSQTCLAKPNSQARTGARKFSPVQLTINRIGNLTQLICTLLYVMTTHTCIRILYCRVYPQLPPVIGAPWGLKKNLNAFVAGTLRGYFLPVRYGSVGVQLTRLRALYQGTLTSGCVWKNLNTSYLYNAAILASFFFIRVFKGVLSSEFVD